MNYDKIAAVIVALEGPLKFFLLFLVFVYVMWFWKVGMYDGFMTTLQVLRTAFERLCIYGYMGIVWVFVSVVRVFRVIFATVRDFFISRI